MKFKLFILALCVAFIIFSDDGRADDWNRNDTFRQAAVIILFEADRLQTLQIKNNPRLYETNIFLGEHPTDLAVNRYFAGAMIGHTAIAYILPPEWRKAWQYVYIGMEAGAVTGNLNLGLQIKY